MFGAAGLAALAACAAALTLGSRDELRQKKPKAAG
jgi:hypothetical protein